MNLNFKIGVIIGILCLLSCNNDNNSYQGYVEGDDMYLSSPFGGEIIKKNVSRGDTVKKGDLLVNLDPNPEAISLAEIESRKISAENTYQDLLNPRRNPEIAAINWQIEKTKEQIKLAELRVDRYKKLYERNAGSKDELDAAKTKLEELKYGKAKLEADLQLARLGSREEQIKAQKSNVDAIDKQLQEAKWKVQQKLIKAPDDGIILDTFYERGEYVAQTKPIISFLDPKTLRAEFFVPVRLLPKIKLGDKVLLSFMGSDTKQSAYISYIADTAEYIPPLVYSNTNESKLVFRVRAKITENFSLFKPGMPVTVKLLLGS